MPRVTLVTSTPTTARSVTSVSEELGISASTLRTWERRYGIGPASRPSGSRRRYLPEDVEVLRVMVSLIRSGIPTGEAAHRARTRALDPLPSLSVADVRATALAGDEERTRSLLCGAIEAHGIVSTWVRLVEPALRGIDETDEAAYRVDGPLLLLTNAFQQCLRATVRNKPTTPLVEGTIVVMSDALHLTCAHVIATALTWYGCTSTILPTQRVNGQCGGERFTRYTATTTPDLVIIVGSDTSCGDVLSELASAGGHSVIVVGHSSPRVLAEDIQRVRTTSACVEEALAYLSPDTDLPPAGSI